ncbi:threonine--tRNA ligase [candidate division KSB1 bacterium]
MKVKIQNKPGLELEVESGISFATLLTRSGLADPDEYLIAEVDGRLVDLNADLNSDAEVRFITFAEPEGRETHRHSSSHLLAQAVKELYPDAKLGIGPAIEDGFYYDFQREEPFIPDDLKRIEKRMTRIAARKIPFQRREIDKKEAVELFRTRHEDYKLELIEDIPDGDKLTLYANDEFVDLCRGPHLPHTGYIKAFKLLSLAGAYWRGDEKQPMLQRVYGVSFDRSEALKEHLERLEEAQKRDHRRLGKQLDLYSIQPLIGAGLVHWHPKGAVVRGVIEDFWRREHRRHGYQLIYTPHIANEAVYGISGHLDYYQENMYSAMDIDGEPFRIKPMNCPGHILIYKSDLRSYRDLPIRYAELGTVYRYERSGVLHGLMRVRGFTQDDAHIFCTPEQLQDEIGRVIDLADLMMRTFGFEYKPFLSTRPDKAIGSEDIWERAQNALKEALESRSIDYEVDPGEGVFYGPKVDIKLWDTLGRGWQGPTIQVDFNNPERFDVEYVGEDGDRHRVVMVHRTVLGSMERFFGCLLEHYSGRFPTWLAPVQVIIMSITDAQQEYADKLKVELENSDIRAETDLRNEKIGLKIREAELQKIPYMVIVGDREVADNVISVRGRGRVDLGSMTLDELRSRLMEEINSRSLTPDPFGR